MQFTGDRGSQTRQWLPLGEISKVLGIREALTRS